MLMANSAAILTDAFPANQRGMALGINQIAGMSGQFVGLLLGGVLAAWTGGAVFWVNVPIGVFGTVWAYRNLREIATTRRARIDWLGNVTFALGAGLLLVAITYGIQPYGGHPTGWTNPVGPRRAGAGVVLLVLFCTIETKIAEPMFEMRAVPDPGLRGRQPGLAAGLDRPRRPAVHAGHLAGRGSGCRCTATTSSTRPLWAGIYMLPLTAGFLIAGPISGWLSDRYGQRLFATAGLLVATVRVHRPDAAADRLPVLDLRGR